MPVLANLGTLREVLREKPPAAPPQGLFFALQKKLFLLRKNVRSLKNLLFRPLPCVYRCPSTYKGLSR